MYMRFETTCNNILVEAQAITKHQNNSLTIKKKRLFAYNKENVVLLNFCNEEKQEPCNEEEGCA